MASLSDKERTALASLLHPSGQKRKNGSLSHLLQSIPRILDCTSAALFIAVVLLFCLLATGQAQEISADRAFRPPDTVDDTPHIHQTQPLLSSPTTLRITLPEVTNSERTAWTEQQENQPPQIGFGRKIPSTYQGDLGPRLQWTTLSDGRLVSALSVTSPRASALRVAVYASLDPGAELRFFSPADHSQRFAPLTQHDFTSQADELSATDESFAQDARLWSPVIEGETIGIKITLPSSAAISTFSLFVDQVSHIVRSLSQAQYRPQALYAVGHTACRGG